MKNSHFGCSGITCRTRCSNIWVVTYGIHQQDKGFCMLKYLTTITVVLQYFSIQELLYHRRSEGYGEWLTWIQWCNMCSATSGPGSTNHHCCVFGVKIWFRFDQIYCYFNGIHLCDLFDSC